MILINATLLLVQCLFPSVLWCCWLGGRKGIQPVKTEWWGAGVVICLERDADLHTAQLMPLPLTVSCFFKIQIGFTFLVLAHVGSPGKRAVKRVCVCVVARSLFMSKFFVFVLCLRVCTVFFIDNVVRAAFLRKHVRLSRVFYNKRTYLLTFSGAIRLTWMRWGWSWVAGWRASTTSRYCSSPRRWRWVCQAALAAPSWRSPALSLSSPAARPRQAVPPALHQPSHALADYTLNASGLWALMRNVQMLRPLACNWHYTVSQRNKTLNSCP